MQSNLLILTSIWYAWAIVSSSLTNVTSSSGADGASSVSIICEKHTQIHTVEPVLSDHSNHTYLMVLYTGGCLMQEKSNTKSSSALSCHLSLGNATNYFSSVYTVYVAYQFKYLATFCIVSYLLTMTKIYKYNSIFGGISIFEHNTCT